MDRARVLEALKTLRAELVDAENLDEPSKAELARLTDEIERQLQAGKPLKDDAGDPLTGRLQGALLGFEAEHPSLTAAVNQVAAALANLGI